MSNIRNSWNGFKLTDEQIAGQRLMAGFEGTELNSALKFLIQDLKVGGIILFSRNIISPQQLGDLCHAAQDFAFSIGQPPLLIAVDQEGGQVARLREPFTIFPGNPFMTGLEDVKHFVRITAAELKSVGINMNLAPVLDIAPKDCDSVMLARSFGDSPEYVSRMGLTMIRQFQQHHIIPCAKHFPGIGRTTVDSHLDLPVSDLSREELEAVELIPFRDAIREGVDSVMLSHVVYPCLDPHWPASLSIAISRDLLRGQMGYQGVILSDDLEMGAVKDWFPFTSAIARLLEAETDLILICHRMNLVAAAYDAIIEQTRASKSLQKAAARSVNRLQYLKQKRLKYQPRLDNAITEVS